ncbi:MAG: divalent metal cation transporter [Gammaproteobacteria bacterium]|nr:divalent metal cation transporter [Gammaproteobacteria bacterium]
MSNQNNTKQLNFIAIITPGVLLAATGVGAGDLATASFAGSHLGVAVLWAVILGGVLKYVVTEGLVRWQLVTGLTFLEGVALKLGRVVGWCFLPYLLLWTFFVGTALMSACGVALHALIPIFDDAQIAKVVFGSGASLLGLFLVKRGGFRLFEKIMGVCIATMFLVVIVTAVLVWPGTAVVLKGMFIPSIPDSQGDGIIWTLALIGGVGGTLTILCYGYWIREKHRNDVSALRICRIDLGVGYFMTVLFGLAMVIIGSTIEIEGKGADLLVTLANQLHTELGSVGSGLFLLGAFGAVFSSLLGVWQAVPYLFADFWRIFFKASQRVNDDSNKDLCQSQPYKIYMWGIAIIPMLGLMMSFKEVQKLYAVIGVAFIPLVALALLLMNSQRAGLGQYANSWITRIALLTVVVFFGALAGMKWVR